MTTHGEKEGEEGELHSNSQYRYSQSGEKLANEVSSAIEQSQHRFLKNRHY